jgi:hypothetical protein
VGGSSGRLASLDTRFATYANVQETVGYQPLVGRGYSGSVFDGRYVYVIPSGMNSHTTMKSAAVLRFDAKTASWLPKGWYGAF